MSKNDLKALLLLSIIFPSLVKDKNIKYQLNVILRTSYNMKLARGDIEAFRSFSEQWFEIVSGWEFIKDEQNFEKAVLEVLKHYVVQYLGKVSKIRQFTWNQLRVMLEEHKVNYVGIFHETIIDEIEHFLKGKL